MVTVSAWSRGGGGTLRALWVSTIGRAPETPEYVVLTQPWRAATEAGPEVGNVLRHDLPPDLESPI